MGARSVYNVYEENGGYATYRFSSSWIIRGNYRDFSYPEFSLATYNAIKDTAYTSHADDIKTLDERMAAEENIYLSVVNKEEKIDILPNVIAGVINEKEEKIYAKKSEDGTYSYVIWSSDDDISDKATVRANTKTGTKEEILGLFDYIATIKEIENAVGQSSIYANLQYKYNFADEVYSTSGYWHIEVNIAYCVYNNKISLYSKDAGTLTWLAGYEIDDESYWSFSVEKSYQVGLIESAWAHEHTFDETTWESDEDYHWHPATCGHSDAVVKEAHAFGEWTVSTPGSMSYTEMPKSIISVQEVKGTKYRECACGYRQEESFSSERRDLEDYSEILNWMKTATAKSEINFVSDTHLDPFAAMPYSTIEEDVYTSGDANFNSVLNSVYFDSDFVSNVISGYDRTVFSVYESGDTILKAEFELTNRITDNGVNYNHGYHYVLYVVDGYVLLTRNGVHYNFNTAKNETTERAHSFVMKHQH